MADTKNAAAARALRILDYLPGNALTGISNAALAKALGTSPVNISRALATLEQEGLAARLDNGLWAPTPKFLAWGMAYMDHTDTIKQRADELQKRTLARMAHHKTSTTHAGE